LSRNIADLSTSAGEELEKSCTCSGCYVMIPELFTSIRLLKADNVCEKDQLLKGSVNEE
jgi:hypothetical protein